ncbi:MAG: acyl--CoA ligase [Rhodobacteraceae bacterium]|nr:acyl--CoA ligase [Paracoccaceae bacterium]
MQQSIFQNGTFPACPASFNMARHTLGHGKTPDKIALEVITAPGQTESWTYQALELAVLQTAGGFRQLGIKPRDRVALRIGNRAGFPILFFALNALGAVPVPLSGMLTDAEVRPMLEDLDAAMICADIAVENPACSQVSGHEIDTLHDSQAIEFVDTFADDPAYIVFTSGTGGRPKGVVHAQRAAWARRMMWQGWYGLQSDDRVLHAGAFNWTYTLGAGLTDPWAIGATALIYTGEKAREIWAKIAAAQQPTVFAAAPGVYRQILDSSGDLARQFSSLRHGLSAGEALPVSILQGWNTRTRKPIYEALGMSEISTFASHSPNSAYRAGTTGMAQPGRKIAVLDSTKQPVEIGQQGLLAVHHSDPGLMLNYLNQPAPSDEWFITGDRAVMDADGYITHLGRNDDMINAGGYRVSPQEIVNVLLTHKGIRECIAMELLVKRDTSVIAAFYTGKPQSAVDLKTHCALGLAAYKCPRKFIHLDTIPRSENGKLLKAELRKGYDWKDNDDA